MYHDESITESVGDPLNPLLFQMNVGQEVMDVALSRRGIVPNDLVRAIVVKRLKDGCWGYLKSSVDALAEEMETTN